ncbi:MAG: hypothetical protein KC493_09850 [Bacteriovoracaceae bacterium]|nr:hypothetical protein [Bacteriovoracaceae bacterium]
MKTLILLAVLFSSTAFASVTGDKIHFQSDSTYVSAVFSKTLCLNGDTYEAMITKCMEWTNDDDRDCVRYGKVFATQPMNSTRQRCAQYSGGDDDRCREWVTVPYVQSPVRTVKWYRDSDNKDVLIRTEIVTVPACN